MWNRFADRVLTIQNQKRSSLALWLAPRLQKLPLPMQRYDDPFLPYGKAIIEATHDLVCAYVFDLAAYLALGAAGAVALERSIAFVGEDAVTILHGPFASTDYVELTYETAFNVDAVTLVKGTAVEPYTARPTRGAFVMRYDEPQNLWFDQGEAGVYWAGAGLFDWYADSQRVWRLRLTDGALNESLGDDFAEKVRAACEKARDADTTAA